MREIIVFLLTIIYVGTGFILLLPKPMKFRYYALLLGHLFLVYTALVPLGQWLTLPLVFLSILIVYLGNKRDIWCVLLSLMGYLILTLMNHLCTVPLSLFGISATAIATDYIIPFLLYNIAATASVLLLIKKYIILPRLSTLRECPGKLQLVFLAQLLLCVALFAINFVYGELVAYPTEVLTFNGILISIFALFTLLLFLYLYQLLDENYQLKLQQKEQEMLKDYAERMEGFYEEFRVFRHDYKNILSTMDYYITEGDVPTLQQYFQQQILPTKDALSADHFVIGKLHLVELPGIKSILYTKLLAAMNHGVSPTLEILEPLQKVDMDELVLSRILGILLDNATEAAVNTEEKYLHIAIVLLDDRVTITIENSYQPLNVPVSTLYEKGYSSKEGHSGLGLYTVQNILTTADNATYSVLCDNYFRQTLEVHKQ